MKTLRLFVCVMVAVALLTGAPAWAQEKSLDPTPIYPIGEITIEAKSLAAGVGFNWGVGTLKFKGKEYHFKVKGLSAGAVGFSKISAYGDVYNLKEAADLAGNYVSVSSGLALAKGVEGLVMRNNKGTLIVLRAQQQGVKLSMAVDGFSIEMVP
jgi:hypothetical protein|uniref:DUF1134 domain-containing protein n=1 Tax=Desulfobacca acetoxidans TaxID=60893 RepID=A0A7C5AMA1_9BACT